MKRRGFLASLFALPAAVKAASELPKPVEVIPPKIAEEAKPEPAWGEMGDTVTCITMFSACSITSELTADEAALMLRIYKR
jgi:hypothetical protein